MNNFIYQCGGKISTTYTTIPKIKYEDFLQSEIFIFSDPEKPQYIVPHKLIKCEKYKGSLFVYKDFDGSVGFERFGIQNPKLLLNVIIEYKVKIVDYCGIEYKGENYD